MANRLWNDVQAFDTFETLQGGSFLPQSTAAPTVPTIATVGAQTTPILNGNGTWKVARTGVGKFVLTFGNPLGMLKCVRVSLQQSASSQLKMTVGPISLANRTIELDCVSTATGVLTDIAANASNVVHWSIQTSLDNSQNQASTPG